MSASITVRGLVLALVYDETAAANLPKGSAVTVGPNGQAIPAADGTKPWGVITSEAIPGCEVSVNYGDVVCGITGGAIVAGDLVIPAAGVLVAGAGDFASQALGNAAAAGEKISVIKTQ